MILEQKNVLWPEKAKVNADSSEKQVSFTPCLQETGLKLYKAIKGAVNVFSSCCQSLVLSRQEKALGDVEMAPYLVFWFCLQREDPQLQLHSGMARSFQGC